MYSYSRVHLETIILYSYVHIVHLHVHVHVMLIRLMRHGHAILNLVDTCHATLLELLELSLHVLHYLFIRFMLHFIVHLSDTRRKSGEKETVVAMAVA